MINGVSDSPLPTPVAATAAVSKQAASSSADQSSVKSQLNAVLQSLAGDAGGLNELVLAKLNELSKVLTDRSNLLLEMPETVQQEARNLLQQTAVTPQTVSKGMAVVVQQQKQAARQLLELSATLEDSVRLPVDTVKAFLAVVPSGPKLLPRQAAQLAKMLDAAAQELAQPQGMLEQAANDKAATVLQKIVDLLKPQLPAARNGQPPNGGQQLSQPGSDQSLVHQPSNLMQPSTAVRSVAAQAVIPLSEAVDTQQALPRESAAALGEDRSQGQGQQPVAQFAAKQSQQAQPGQHAAEAGYPIAQPSAEQSASAVKLPAADSRQPDKQPAAPQTMQAVPVKVADQPETVLSPAIRSLTVLVRELTAAFMPDAPVIADSSSEQLPNLPSIPTKLLEKMPAALRQLVGSDQPSGDLPVLWSLLKAQELNEWQHLDPQERTKAAAALKKFAHSLLREEAPQGESRATHTALSCSLPLYFGDNPTPYPAFIHLYHQREEQEGEGGYHFETWLRIIIQTENAGPADVVFRLYDSKKLDIRMGIGNAQAAQELNQAIPEIRAAMASFPLEVRQVTASTVKI